MRGEARLRGLERNYSFKDHKPRWYGRFDGAWDTIPTRYAGLWLAQWCGREQLSACERMGWNLSLPRKRGCV